MLVWGDMVGALKVVLMRSPPPRSGQECYLATEEVDAGQASASCAGELSVPWCVGVLAQLWCRKPRCWMRGGRQVERLPV